MTEKNWRRALWIVVLIHIALPVLGGVFDVLVQSAGPDDWGTELLNGIQLVVHFLGLAILATLVTSIWVMPGRSWRLVLGPLAALGLTGVTGVMTAWLSGRFLMTYLKDQPVSETLTFGVGALLGSWEWMVIGLLWTLLTAWGAYVRWQPDETPVLPAPERVARASRRLFVVLVWFYVLVPMLGGFLDLALQILPLMMVPCMGLVLAFLDILLQTYQGVVHLTSVLFMIALVFIPIQAPRWEFLRSLVAVLITGITWALVVVVLLPMAIQADVGLLHEGMPPLVTVGTGLLAGWEFIVLGIGFLGLAILTRTATAGVEMGAESAS